jgi:hypothetical protein
VRLIAPKNNATISADNVTLAWILEDSLSTDSNLNLSYEIKFDKHNPPQISLEYGYHNESLFVGELENGFTYYWTVLPKRNELNGSCLSGVWSFKVDIPVPNVKLMIPMNNSKISSILPTLAWKVQYDGREKLSYHVYFGTSPEFGLDPSVVKTTYFTPKNTLKPGQRYYWQIVPFAGKYNGPASEIWTFMVNGTEEKLTFKLNLTLEPYHVTLTPQQTVFVKARVTNLGLIIDNITLEIKPFNCSGLNVDIYGSNNKEISIGATDEFLIRIMSDRDSKPAHLNLTVSAVSKNAESYGIFVHDDKILSMTITIENEPENSKTTNNNVNWLWMFLILIILCILIIFIFIIIRKKRNGTKNEIVEITQVQHEDTAVATPLPSQTEAIPTKPEPITTITPTTFQDNMQETQEDNIERNLEE